jgi:hypothetical protein
MGANQENRIVEVERTEEHTTDITNLTNNIDSLVEIVSGMIAENSSSEIEQSLVRDAKIAEIRRKLELIMRIMENHERQ